MNRACARYLQRPAKCADGEKQRAEERGLTVIRVPVNAPFEALLIWTVEDRREVRRLFAPGARVVSSGLLAVALDDQLIGPPFDASSVMLDWFGRGMTLTRTRRIGIAVMAIAGLFVCYEVASSFVAFLSPIPVY